MMKCRTLYIICIIRTYIHMYICDDVESVKANSDTMCELIESGLILTYARTDLNARRCSDCSSLKPSFDNLQISISTLPKTEVLFVCFRVGSYKSVYRIFRF